MKRLPFHNLVFILILIAFPAYTQQGLREEAATLHRLIQEVHYAPIPLTDDFCNRIAEELINNLDPRKNIFTAEEVKELGNKSFVLSSDLKGTTWQFIPRLSKIYLDAIERSENTSKKFLAMPIDLKKGDTLHDPTSLPFAASLAELEKRKENHLKHQILVRLYSLPDSILKSPLLKTYEQKARDRVQKSETKRIAHMRNEPKGVQRVLSDQLFNAYTTMLDAHSVYLPKELFESLRGELDTEELSYGLELKENEEGDVQISRLVPGGPAWKTNQLFKDDILVTIKIKGQADEYVEGMGMEEVGRLLDVYTNITLVVKETNGRIKDVPLQKERIRKEENKVKGIILKGERKVGYISLPGFYTEWENSEAGCSNDVAREILKLKEEGIEGIILDIRYNGGGSLYEGLNMAGIFINEGPLYLKKDKDQKVIVVKDMNRGTVYDGPLVVMINGQSASASELLAAVLQDYNRALIVGNTSYGKATGQTMMPIDTSNNELMAWKKSLEGGNGYTLLTTQKLFRITGKTAQIKGVIPDIEFPDYMEGFEEREADKPTALPAEEVVKKVYYTPLPVLPVEQLKKRSNDRIATTELNKIPALHERFYKIPEYRILTLSFYQNQYSQYSKIWDELEATITGKDSAFTCENTAEMKKILDLDEYERDNNSSLMESLEQDVYLQESFRILSDMINLK